MDFEDWPTQHGVRQLTSAWFDRAEEFDEDVLLDEPPLAGLRRHPDTRLPLDRALERLGPVVATHELAAAGIDAMSLRSNVERGRLVRLRKGWFARPDLPHDVALAWRIGGPLGCISALRHQGFLSAAEVSADGELHVSVRGNTSRIPSALTITTYARAHSSEPEKRSVVRHWSTADYRSGDRLAVSVDAALEQARHCRPVLARRARERARKNATGDAAAPSGSAPPSASR